VRDVKARHYELLIGGVLVIAALGLLVSAFSWPDRTMLTRP
jgi:hypothetical protein